MWLYAALLLLTAADCLSRTGSSPVRRRTRPRRAGSSPPKLPSTSLFLKCAGCGVETSGEVSFIDHINGAAHRRRCGETGYVGLLPNQDGMIPPLGPELRVAYDAYLKTGEPQQVVCKSDAQASRTTRSIESRARNFKADPTATELQFEAGLTKEERALVHELAKRFKLGSKSRGHQEERYVTIYKRHEWPRRSGGASWVDSRGRWQEDASGIEGSDDDGGGELEPWVPPLRQVSVSSWAIGATERTLGLVADRTDTPRPSTSGRDGGQRSRASQRAPRPLPPPPDVLDPEGGPMAAARASLPVHAYRSQLLEALTHRVSIVEGETGSGKTTQVGQFQLEQAAASGASVSIICTQPRRISAIGVAERVAAERGEKLGEGAVGYAVRGESRQSSRTSLLFCTTGVLIKMLEAVGSAGPRTASLSGAQVL